MKKLKEKKIKTTSLSKIYGGELVSSVRSRNTMINGTRVIEITSDSFDDKDGDRKWDANESGNECVSYLTN